MKDYAVLFIFLLLVGLSLSYFFKALEYAYIEQTVSAIVR